MKTHFWMGKPITELSKEELIEVIDYCMKEISRLRKDRDRWMEAGDAIKYIMLEPPNEESIAPKS